MYKIIVFDVFKEFLQKIVLKMTIQLCIIFNFVDPLQWSVEDVKSWLLWTVQQFSIPMSLLDLDLWNMDGQAFMGFGEEDFKQRLPQREGETLFAQFDIWRTNSNYEQAFPQSCGQESQQVPRYAPPPYPDYWGGESHPGAEGHHAQGPASHEAISHSDNFSDIAYMLQVRQIAKVKPYGEKKILN